MSIGRPAVSALVQALDDGNRDARWEAAKALGEIGDPSAAAALVETLGRDQFAIRWLAAQGLISFGRQGLEPLLSALLLNPDSGFLRDGAHHVLHALRDKDSSLRNVLAPLVHDLGTFGQTGDIVAHIEAALKEVQDNATEARATRRNEPAEES